MGKLLVRFIILILIGGTVYYVYGIYLKTHEVVIHNAPSLGKEESNYDFVSLLKGQRNGTYKTFYPNGQLREEFVIVNGRKNGPSKTYFDNGALRSEDHYKDDQLDGEIKRYEYATGFFFSVNQYKEGLLDGVNKWFYPSGKLRSEEQYVKGLKHGPIKFYAEEGTLSHIVNYTYNEKTGLTTTYNPDGSVASEINYLKGDRDGQATWYYDTGKISNSTHYKADKKDGLSQLYFYSGIMSNEKHFQEDKLHGNVKSFYYNGQIGYEAEYLSGSFHGETKEYYRSGQIESIKSYGNGQLDGPYTLYDKDGKVLLDMVTENGHIKEIRTDNIMVNASLDDIIRWNEGPHFGSIVRFLLHSKQFGKLEQLAELINSTPESRRLMYENYIQGITGSFGAVSIAGTPQEYLALLDAWKETYPDSLAQCLARIRALTSLAWNYRGSNYANATTMASFERFTKTLLEAERLAKEASELPEKNPELFSLWIWVSLGLNHDDRVTQHIFEQGLAVDSLYFGLYEDRLVTLLPKWGGGQHTVEKFIKTSTEKLDEQNGKELYARLVDTLIEFEGRNFLLDFNFDRNQLLDSYYHHVSKNPEDKTTKNWYAWLTIQLQDKERAELAFQLIDTDDFDDDVWNYDDYLASRKWASTLDAKPIVSDIHNAVKRGDKVKLYLFLKNKGDINLGDNSNETLLHTALSSRHPDLAKYLIDTGADVNKANDYQDRPIHLASENGYASIVQLLIEKKATVNVANHSKLTPLHKAAIYGYKDIGAALIKADRAILKQKTKIGRTALLGACENAQTNFVKMLMEYEETDLAEADNDGYNCMHFAVYKKATDLVKLLLKTDIDFLQQKNLRGETPMDVAVKANYVEIIELFKPYVTAPEAPSAAQ